VIVKVTPTEKERRSRGLREVMSVRIDPKVRRALERLAVAEHVTRSEAVTLLVMRAVNEKKT